MKNEIKELDELMAMNAQEPKSFDGLLREMALIEARKIKRNNESLVEYYKKQACADDLPHIVRVIYADLHANAILALRTATCYENEIMSRLGKQKGKKIIDAWFSGRASLERVDEYLDIGRKNPTKSILNPGS